MASGTSLDWWQIILRVFAWAARIPVACVIVFTAGCLAFLAFLFVFRLTAWIFRSVLAHPW